MTKEKKQRKKSLLQENGREVVEPVLPSDDTTKPNSAIKDSQVMSKRIKKVLYSCLKCGGFHLLIENKIFIFIILTFVWTSFGSFGSTIYFNARAVFDVGLTQLEASYLISAIGLGNLLGRVGHGIFLDRNFMTPLGMYSLTSVISAISIICYPFLDNFWTLLSCALIFGLTNGPYPSLQVMVLRDMLSPGDVSGGFGVVLFFNGFAMVTGVLIMSKFHFISYHILMYHVMSLHRLSFHVTSRYVTSSHFSRTSCNSMSCHTLRHTTSSYVNTGHSLLCHVSSYYVISHITSLNTMSSCHVVSSYVMWCYVPVGMAFFRIFIFTSLHVNIVSTYFDKKLKNLKLMILVFSFLLSFLYRFSI